jgi:hypothetical protein
MIRTHAAIATKLEARCEGPQDRLLRGGDNRIRAGREDFALNLGGYGNWRASCIEKRARPSPGALFASEPPNQP